LNTRLSHAIGKVKQCICVKNWACLDAGSDRGISRVLEAVQVFFFWTNSHTRPSCIVGISITHVRGWAVCSASSFGIGNKLVSLSWTFINTSESIYVSEKGWR
jgi:predicted membrane protein